MYQGHNYGGPYWGGGNPYPVFIPQPGADGRPPKGKSLVKQFREWKEFQDMMNGGSGKKDEKKEQDKPKQAMIPIPTALFLGVLLSPAVGPVMYMLYKSLWAMALK